MSSPTNPSNDRTCPLCVRKMDDTDFDLPTCSCGYQLCLFCLNKIKASSNPSCPSCHKQYPAELSNIPTNDPTVPVTVPVHHASLSYEELSSIRVRQKNLVYVVGLPINLCDENILKTKKWFGNYGKIKKIYCNKKSSHITRTSSFAAFITYYKEKDAVNCIKSMNGHYLDDGSGRMLRATTGSTKYCSYFVRKTICNNPSCAYLHDWANSSDVVTKEELNDFGIINKYNNSYSYDDTSNNNDNNNIFDNDNIDDNDVWNRNSNRNNINRIALNSKSSKSSKLLLFDYTRIVKKGLNDNKDNKNIIIKNEYPPLTSSNSSHNTHKTPPHIRTKPPMMNTSNAHNKRRTKSEILSSSKAYHNINIPPKISLDNTKTQTQTPHTKSVNFDSTVDVIDGGIDKIYIQSKVNVNYNNNNNNKIQNKQQTQTQNQQQMPHRTPNINNKKAKRNNNNNNKSSNRMLAQIFLDELLKNNISDNIIINDDESNGSGASGTGSSSFKMSDLLKDGFVGDDELNDYNNYYFLKSDDYIFGQFHYHWNYIRQQAKSKA